MLGIPQPITTPDKPRAPQVSAGNGRVIVQWLAPLRDGGTPILRYAYCLKPISQCSGPWVDILDSAPGGANHGQYAIARTNGTYTRVYLRAVNAQGAGPHVNRAAVPLTGAPPAPTNLRGDTISAEHVTISWREPSAPAGVTITGYDLEHSRDGVTWAHDFEARADRQQYLGGGQHPPGTTSVTVRIGEHATLHYRIRTLFRTTTPTVVRGTDFSQGASPSSPIIEVTTVGAEGTLALPALGVTDGFGREGPNAAIVFDVSLTRPHRRTSPVTVVYRTQDGTARAGSDYTATSGTLSFAAGETAKTVSVPIIDDTVEDSGEEFALQLSNVFGAILTRSGGIGTIYNQEDLLTGFTLVDAASGTDIGSLTDGSEVTLDAPATGQYGIRVETVPETGIGSVRLALSGAKTVTRTDNAAPYTLYAAGGEGLPPGAYTLQATAYADPDGGGTARQTRSVSFTVAAATADADDGAALSATFPASRFASTRHTGSDDRPQVVVTFSEPLASFATDTPSVQVTGGTVASVQAHTEDGLENAYVFFVTPAGDGDVTFALVADAACAAGGLCTAGGTGLTEVPATLTIPGPDDGADAAELTAAFEGVPAEHDGQSAFTVRVAFSEDVGISYVTLRDESFSVTDGDVTGARRVDGRHDLWEMTVEPESREAVTISLPGGRACGPAGAVCTRGDDPRPLRNSPSATMAGPAEDPAVTNTAATGAPTISGTAQVDETLTASVSGMSDADGLDNASYEYQWIRGNTDIQDATDSSYTLVSVDEGETIKVRVTFSDDKGHEESLTSAATDAVAPAPAPLTATFTDVPAEHAGAGETFTFGLTFSEDVAGLSFKTLRDRAFTVTGGAVRKAQRRQPGSNEGWTITVDPDSHAAVTIRLPAGAVETADGRGLARAVSATVAGPVGIAVADARVDEGAGAVLAFAVTLSRAASGVVTVDYATTDGSAHAGDDYTAASGTLTFQTGESSQTIEVAVLDDAHDEGEETLTLTLSNAAGGRLTDGEATGTIKNTDPVPRALLARFGRTAAVHVVEHVEERIAAPREPGVDGRFAGRALRPGMAREMALSVLNRLGGSAGAHPLGGDARGPLGGSPAGGMGSHGTPGLAAGTPMAAAGGPIGAVSGLGATAGPLGAAGPDGGVTGGGLLQMGLGGGDLLTGSAVAVNRETHGGILSFWSRGARSSFAGREGALSLGGDVRTTMVGADYAKGPLVAGLSLSHSRGLGEYVGVTGGQVASSVTGLYPWLGYQVTDRVSVWGVTGYGAGGLWLTPDGGPELRSGLSMAMAAAGTRGELVAGGAGGFALAFKADALWVGTSIDGVDGAAGRLAATEAAVTRFRTGLEGSRAYTLAGRLSLRPSVEVGLRQDGGDAENGAGMDVGGGLMVSDTSTGLAVDLRVRMLVMHQAEGFSERGMALSLSYNPTPSTPLGFVARVAPSWGGQATSGAEALWGRESMGGMGHESVRGSGGHRLDTEVGYGLPIGSRFVGTPRAGVRTSEYGRDYRIGYGVGVLEQGRLNLQIGVDAERRESALFQMQEQGAGTDQRVLGRATVQW